MRAGPRRGRGSRSGLHVNFTNEAQRLVDLEDPRRLPQRAARASTPASATWSGACRPTSTRTSTCTATTCAGGLFEELADEQALPLRDRPPVVFKGGLLRQWTYGVSEPEKVSFEALERILRHEIARGHLRDVAAIPGYHDPALEAVYHREREHELRTLTDPRLRPLLEELGIALVSYRELSRVREVSAAEQASARPAAVGGGARRVAGRCRSWSRRRCTGAGRGRTAGRPGSATWRSSSHQDVAFAAGVRPRSPPSSCASAGAGRARERWVGAVLVRCGRVFVLYAVVSVQIFAFLRSPLTYALLYLAGDMGSMRSSIGSFVTPRPRRRVRRWCRAAYVDPGPAHAAAGGGARRRCWAPGPRWPRPPAGPRGAPRPRAAAGPTAPTC